MKESIQLGFLLKLGYLHHNKFIKFAMCSQDVHVYQVLCKVWTLCLEDMDC